MGRAPCCEKVGLKRGRWTAEEDQLLVNYIKANGEGSWRSLPKNAGLLRCGKSCRLRWINYLREDLKRGNISPEEEDTIIKLQATLGNRWSLIAGHLPGRTDNEIKNYWNSHLSKKAQGLLDADESDGSAAPAATTGKRKRSRGGGSGQPPTIKKKKKKSSSSNNLDGEIKEDPATKKQQQKKSLLPVGATTGPSKAIVSSTVAEDDPLQTTGEGSQGVDGTDLLRELEEEEEVTVQDGSVMVHSSMCLIMGATTKQIKEVAGSEGSHEEGDGRATSSITEEREAGAASVATSLSSEGTSSEERADVGVEGNACGDDGAAKGQEEESFNFEGFENLPWEDVGDIWNCLWDGGQELDMQSTLGFHLCEDNFENWLFSDIL